MGKDVDGVTHANVAVNEIDFSVESEALYTGSVFGCLDIKITFSYSTRRLCIGAGGLERDHRMPYDAIMCTTNLGACKPVRIKSYDCFLTTLLPDNSPLKLSTNDDILLGP
jgi:hypothetical protein